MFVKSICKEFNMIRDYNTSNTDTVNIDFKAKISLRNYENIYFYFLICTSHLFETINPCLKIT